MRVFIALGSNMGDRRQYLRSALDMMGERVGRILKQSSEIETEAYGYTDQEDFINMVAEIDTDCSPMELLDKLHRIENELDRRRTIRWGPRTIDLDILFYGDEIIEEESLHIPHVDFRNRSFVLDPMCEIAADFIDPQTGKTMEQLRRELENRQSRKE